MIYAQKALVTTLVILVACCCLAFAQAVPNPLMWGTSVVPQSQETGDMIYQQRERDLKELGGLVSVFLNPDMPAPEAMPIGGQLFFSWQYWMAWKLGERTSGISSDDIRIRTDKMMADLVARYGELEVNREMRRDLEYMARRDIANERMIESIKSATGRDVVTPDEIISYLARIYNDDDLIELESLFKFFSVISKPLNSLVGANLFGYYSSDAGLISGTVLALRKEMEREFGRNFMVTTLPDDPIYQKISEEFNILSALKGPVESLLGRPLNFFHPDGNDFGFLRGFSSQVDGGLKDPPSEVLTTPVWKLGTLAEKRTLDYVINQRIPRWTFLRGILERAYGHEYDIVRDSSDINLIAHWNTCMETYGWTEYTVMKKLIPNVGSSIAGAVRGFFGGFNWDNRIVRNEPVSLAGSEQPIDLNSGNTVNVDIPEGSQNWRHYAYLRFYVNTEVSDADSIVVTIRNADGEVAEYTVDITALPRARRAEVVIPIRRYIVDDNGNGIRDVIAWDGFIGNDSWKSYVSTDLDSNTELSGITDFSRILSWSLQSVGGYVKIEL